MDYHSIRGSRQPGWVSGRDTYHPNQQRSVTAVHAKTDGARDEFATRTPVTGLEPRSQLDSPCHFPDMNTQSVHISRVVGRHRHDDGTNQLQIVVSTSSEGFCLHCRCTNLLVPELGRRREPRLRYGRGALQAMGLKKCVRHTLQTGMYITKLWFLFSCAALPLLN